MTVGSAGVPITGAAAPGTAEPLVSLYDSALLDLDGVVYVGAEAVPYAVSALTAARDRDQAHAYVTNNASRPPSSVADHLSSFGLTVAESDVVTSAVVTAQCLDRWLAPGAAVLAVGGIGVREALETCGYVALDPLDPTTEGQADAVVMGFGADVGWRHLARASVEVRRGVPFIATNLDRTVPTPAGPAPGNGLLVAAVAAASREPDLVVGKPGRTMFEQAATMMNAARPLVVGDRLDTDIEGAHAAGMDSLLVFTGVTDVPTLLAAPPHYRPTYLGLDLRSLLSVHPAVTAESDGETRWRCGDWVASRSADEVVVDRRPLPGPVDVESDGVDAIRAACAASWSQAGDVWTPPARVHGLDAVIESLARAE